MMLLGEAKQETSLVCGWVTTTWAVAVSLPFPLVAVRVYVVVAVGVTTLEPIAGTLPRPLMVTDSALRTLQDNVEFCPTGMDVGSEMKNRTCGRSADLVETRTLAAPCPPRSSLTIKRKA